MENQKVCVLSITEARMRNFKGLSEN